MNLKIYIDPKDCEYTNFDLETAKSNLERSYQIAKIFLQKIEDFGGKLTLKEKIFAQQINLSFDENYKNYRNISPVKLPKKDLDWISEIWKTKKTIEEILK